MTKEDLAWAINAALEEHSKRSLREDLTKAALTGLLAARPDYLFGQPGEAVKFADATIAALGK
jgi:hypothetical protein